MTHLDAASDTAPGAALKHLFNTERLRHIARETAAVYPAFDSRAFLAACAEGHDDLSLMQRLRRVAESLHATLPQDFAQALVVLRALAPRLDNAFVTMVLPDYVALYGTGHFAAAMDALKFFTRFGSSEFAVRVFLQQDLQRSLKQMEKWSRDPDAHVRRLASEGCRPRLPWSFRIRALVDDPSPVLLILENLKADPSPYVRKSVANHLNDITKDHPAWVLDLLERWPRDDPHTAWIVRHSLRTLVKKGDRRALALLGAGHKAEVRLHDLSVAPAVLRLGESLTLSFVLASTSRQPQRLVVDYAVHYVKKAGGTSAKVFKLKTIELAAGARVALARRQSIRDFTTRVHYAGTHAVDVLVNGDCLGSVAFDLRK